MIILKPIEGPNWQHREPIPELPAGNLGRRVDVLVPSCLGGDEFLHLYWDTRDAQEQLEALRVFCIEVEEEMVEAQEVAGELLALYENLARQPAVRNPEEGPGEMQGYIALAIGQLTVLTRDLLPTWIERFGRGALQFNAVPPKEELAQLLKCLDCVYESVHVSIPPQAMQAELRRRGVAENLLRLPQGLAHL